MSAVERLEHGLVRGSSDNAIALTEQEIQSQVNLIQRVMKQVMKRDVHYGVVPGCGNRPALLKPGAEKICLTFKLAAKFAVTHDNLPDGHREYSVNCTLTTPDGVERGQGIGVCSTMESKYRYRWDATGKSVPQNYWDDKDLSKLGGPQFAPRKVQGKWMIYQKVAHDNPADYLNTVAKMAKKRAHVDATLTTTAASDIFDQDVDELVEAGVAVNDNTPQNRPGKQAVNRAQLEGDSEHRDALIATLEGAPSMEDLLKTWQTMSEEDRTLVGSEFGRIKKAVQ